MQLASAGADIVPEHRRRREAEDLAPSPHSRHTAGRVSRTAVSRANQAASSHSGSDCDHLTIVLVSSSMSW
jgi:hypothetical protein